MAVGADLRSKLRVDETYIKVKGQERFLYGPELDKRCRPHLKPTSQQALYLHQFSQRNPIAGYSESPKLKTQCRRVVIEMGAAPVGSYLFKAHEVAATDGNTRPTETDNRVIRLALRPGGPLPQQQRVG